MRCGVISTSPPDKSDAALELLCQRLKNLLKADNVKWVAAVRVLKNETFGCKIEGTAQCQRFRSSVRY